MLCPACNTLPRSSYCSQLRAKSFYRIILLRAKLLDQKRFSTRLWPQLFPAWRLRRKRAGAAGDVRLSLELGRPGFSPCSKSPVNLEIRHPLLPFPYQNIGFEEGGCITDSEMLTYYEGDRQKLWCQHTKTSWKPEATCLYDAHKLFPKPCCPSHGQHLHPKISSSRVWASRENQPCARLGKKLRLQRWGVMVLTTQHRRKFCANKFGHANGYAITET